MNGRLPTFLIIGFPKAGTTTLASALDAHPDVFMSREKELHFFDRNYERGLDWYRAQFADAAGARAIGEASPTYAYNDEAMPRIAEVLPDARLIAILRNPIDRAYSNYWYQRSLGFEPRSFLFAVRKEMAKPDVKVFPNLKRGRYLPYLERVCALVPRSNLSVVLFEELRDRPADVLGEVFRFLGVDPHLGPPAPAVRAENRTTMLRSERLRRSMLKHDAWRRVPARVVRAIDRMNRVDRRYPPMDAALRSELVAWFADANADLARWLGRDLSAWDR